MECCDSLSLPSFLGRKEHEKCEFEVHEVYAIDILVSTGEGKVNSLSLAHSLSPHRSLFVSLCRSLSLLSFPSPSFLFPTAHLKLLTLTLASLSVLSLPNVRIHVYEQSHAHAAFKEKISGTVF